MVGDSSCSAVYRHRGNSTKPLFANFASKQNRRQSLNPDGIGQTRGRALPANLHFARRLAAVVAVGLLRGSTESFPRLRERGPGSRGPVRAAPDPSEPVPDARHGWGPCSLSMAGYPRGV